MARRRMHPSTYLLCCALLAGGCATVKTLTQPTIVLPPPTPEARAVLQPLTAIVVETPGWGKLPPTPATQGETAGLGLAEAMGTGCAGAAATPASLLALPMLPLSCVGGAAGGSVAAVVAQTAAARAARPPAEVDAARKALAGAIAALDPAGDLAGEIVARGGRDGVPALLACPATGACVAADGSVPSATLRLAVQPWFVSAGAYNPAVTLYLTAKGRVLGADGKELLWRCWRYRSPAVSYFALAADDGARLKAELDWGWKAPAARIVDDVFVTTAPVTLAPEGFPGEAMALSGAGERVEGDGAASRETMKDVLEASDRPPASAEGLDCLGPAVPGEAPAPPTAR